MRDVVRRIISGGQTGADRAALDVAIALGIEQSGWVPRGRWAEDGPLAPRYQVREASSSHLADRTELNVRDSDATLILSHGPLTGGSALTLFLAQERGKPVLHVDLVKHDEASATRLATVWIAEVRPAVLNVAGPRASIDPLIYDAVSRVLRRIFEAAP
jgi:hypothetical protein